MSAAEIIEMIEKLPLRSSSKCGSSSRKKLTASKMISDAEFERAARRVFADNQDLLRRLATR